MKKILNICLVLIISITLINKKVKALELVLAQNSKSAILIEVSTGNIIFEKDAKTKRPPASMTKIMTLILIMEALEKGLFDMDTMLEASSNATKMGGTQIYLEVGEKMSVSDLLKAVAIASANDATVVFAEAISGSIENFVTLMNQKASELGLVNTNFENTNGLPSPNHYSCSYDMGIMGWYLVSKYEDTILKFTNIYEDYLRKGTEDEFWLVNTNKLIKFYEEVDGLKTGWTSEAGYCLTATMKKNGIRFIAVSMGCSTSSDRNSDIMQMLNYGVNNYELKVILKKDEIIESCSDLLLKPNKFNVVVNDDVTVLVKKGQKIGKVTTNIKLNDFVNEKSYIEIYIDNVLYETVELKTSEEIRKASFITVFFEIIKNIFLNTK